MSLKRKFRSIFQCFCLLLVFFVKKSTGQVIQQMTNILPADSTPCAVPYLFSNITAVYPPTITVPADSITQSGYSISSIPIDSSTVDGTSVSLADDAFGGPYPIGFTFNYYGVNYTNFYISANGYIGFTSPLPNTFNFNGNNMTNIATLCADTSNLPNNAIFGYYQDFNPLGVTNAIQYQTSGAAPNRVLTVYFSNLPFFNSCTETSSFRIKILETTGVIQIHLNNKPICSTLWQGSGYSGLAPQCPSTTNSGCTTYTLAGTDQAFSNVAFQYNPFIVGNTEPIIASVSNVNWQGIQGVNNTSFTISNTTNTNSVPIFIINPSQSPRKYIIKITYDLPCASDIVYIDTFVIRYVPPPTSLFSVTETGGTSPSSICLNDSVTITYTGNASPPLSTYTYLWDFDGGTASPATGGPGPFNISWSTPGTKNITLKVVAGTCTSAVTTRLIIVNPIITPPPTSTFTVPSSVCLGENVLVDYTGTGSETVSYSWSFDGGNATQLGPNNNDSYNVNWITPGIKNITLSVGCASEVSSSNITVFDNPSVIFSPVTTFFCNNNASVDLIGGFPLGGIYSGAGVSNGSFNPATAGSGLHPITYTYTDANGCSNASSAVFEVAMCTCSIESSELSLCTDESALLTVQSSAIDTLMWGSNLINGPFTGGTLSIIEYSAAQGASNYLGSDFGSNCNEQWRPYGTFCDEGQAANSPFLSEKSNTNSGATWINGSGGYGILVLDLQEAKTFNALSAFQMFSDGKLTQLSMFYWPENISAVPTSSSTEWVSVFSNGLIGPGSINGNTASNPTVLEFGSIQSRYLMFHAYNSGTYGDNLFIEIRSLKLFNKSQANSEILWSTGETTPSITVSPTETSTYSVTINQGGQTCSSEVTIQVNQPSISSQTVTSCQQFTWNGNTYSQSGTQTWTGINAAGCDSVVTLNLTITPNPTISFSPDNSTFCNNSASVDLIGGIPLGGVYSGAGVSNGEFNPSSAGSGLHPITYTYTDVNGCSNASSAVFEVAVCTGVETFAEPVLEVRPNPMESSTFVSLKNYVGQDSQFNLLLMDATGRKVFEKRISAEVIREGYLLNIPNLASGTYLLMLNNSNYNAVKRLVK